MVKTMNIAFFYKVILFSILILFLMIQGSIAEKTVKPKCNLRLGVVNTPGYSGLMDYLLQDFTKETGITVETYSGKDIYTRADQGEFDILISHYGKPRLKNFIDNGYGFWPRMVFANQAVIIGPKNDPAGIKGLRSSIEAFKRIADTRSPFIISNMGKTSHFLADYLYHSSGEPDAGDWFRRINKNKKEAVRQAEKEKAYTIWGAFPFLRYQKNQGSELEVMVYKDSLLQRVMVAIVVNPEKIAGVNHEGAITLQDYLISPKTQAKVAAYRCMGVEYQLWYPAARHN